MLFRSHAEYEWDHVFVATLTAGVPAADQSEVREVRWASPGPLAAEIAARPDGFTPWLAGVLDLAGQSFRDRGMTGRLPAHQ